MERSGTDLTPATCWELLATATVGRIALSIRALPAIVPVRYQVDEPAVAINLGQPGLPAATVHDAVVAFAVDAIDVDTASGWMVQMQGWTTIAPHPAPVDPGPSAADQILRLVPATVTGHRFTLESFHGMR